MAAGKPVVASDIEGFAAIVTHGDQGLLFPRKDSEALANALSLLITDPELARRMGARGREAAKEYRWERVAGQVEEYYEHCLRSDNGHSWKRAN